MFTHIAIRTEARPQVRQQFLPLLAGPSISSCPNFNHLRSVHIQHLVENSEKEKRNQ